MSETRTIHVYDSIGVNDVEAVAGYPPKPGVPPKPDAPYGYKADGTPYQRDPASYAGGRRKPGATPRKKGTAKKRASAPDYRPAVLALFQSVAAPLAILGASDDVFLADAVAVTNYAPGIAEALNDIAQDNPALAAVLTKVAQVGPYGALVMATVPLVAQIAVNHKALPVSIGGIFGVTDPDDLLADIKAEAEAQQAARRQRAQDAVNVIRPESAGA